jgi:hypothetical protein
MEKMTMTVGAVAIGGLAMLASLRAQSTPANSTITANVIDVDSIQTEIYRTSENDFECLARTGVNAPATMFPKLSDGC